MHFINQVFVVSLLSLLINGQCDNGNVKSSDDLKSLASCTKLNSLSITGEGLDSVNLDSLQSVSSIKVSATSTLTKLSFSKLSSAASIQVDNNSGLTSLSLPSLSQLSGYLFISGNSPKLEVDLGKLGSIGGNATFANCTAVTIGNLGDIKDNLAFDGNSFKELKLTKLKTASNSLSITNSANLASLDISSLESVGGAFAVLNNTNLKSIDAEKLSNVNGGLEFSGNFDKVGLDSLNEVKGGAVVASDSKSFGCDKMKGLQAVTQGTYSCQDTSSGGSSSGNRSKTNSTTKSNKTASGSSSDAYTYNFYLGANIAAVAIISLLV